MKVIIHNISRPLAFICGLIACFAAVSAPADSIRMHDQAGSAGPGVTLGQIAELDGEYAQTLGDLSVGRFADRQGDLTVQLATVRRVLTEAQVNWADLSLRGRSSCVVTRLHAPDADAQIANDRAVTTREDLAVDQPNAGMTVSDLLIDEIVRLNATDRENLEISFRTSGAEVAWLNRSAAVGRYELESLSRTGLGRVPVKVRRYEPSGTIEETTLTAEVARRAEVVVVLRQLRRGEVFTSDNVGVRSVLLTSDHGQTVDRLDLMLGQASAAALREGTVVRADHVAPDVMVKRGQLVTVACVTGSLVVRTVAKASEDGVLGDVIAFRNEETRETFYATVSGKQQAIIRSGTDPNPALATAEENR